MQVESKTDKLNRCSCGHKPLSYWIGYSRTPYYINCKCGKHVGDVGGSPQNIIDAWNDAIEGVEAKIDFDKECWVCGVDEPYNVCISCGADIFMASYALEGTDRIIHHLKEVNIERYNQMIKQSER